VTTADGRDVGRYVRADLHEVGEGRVVGHASQLAHLRGPHGGVRAGALLTLLDFAGGVGAGLASLPDGWVVSTNLTARIVQVPELSPPSGDLETEALARNAANLFRQVVELSPMLPDELATVAQNVTQPDRLGDLIAATLPVLASKM